MHRDTRFLDIVSLNLAMISRYPRIQSDLLDGLFERLICNDEVLKSGIASLFHCM